VGTTADTSVTHLALAGGAVGLAGALHHWAPKLFGSLLGEGLGRAAAGLLLLGGLLLAVPDLVSGFLDQGTGVTPERVGQPDSGVAPRSAASRGGGALVRLGGGGVRVNRVGASARRSDEPVPDDPWGGHTLEWRTASPPLPGGPGPLEPVTSPAPLLDARTD